MGMVDDSFCRAGAARLRAHQAGAAPAPRASGDIYIMALDKATVAHIATLARIKLSETEQDKIAGELSHILTWFEQLDEIDTTGVEPMASVAAMRLPMREDTVTEGDRRDELLGNAPAAAHGFFTVPKVVE
jgi:aspartyl-tRNA(Asn)/glutamyl-tRNA(Gln) amidotransferase subunit C